MLSVLSPDSRRASPRIKRSRELALLLTSYSMREGRKMGPAPCMSSTVELALMVKAGVSQIQGCKSRKGNTAAGALKRVGSAPRIESTVELALVVSVWASSPEDMRGRAPTLCPASRSTEGGSQDSAGGLTLTVWV